MALAITPSQMSQWTFLCTYAQITFMFVGVTLIFHCVCVCVRARTCEGGCVRMCGWSRDEVCLIRPELKLRRRREVIPKGEKQSIRKDTPHLQRHSAHHLLHTPMQIHTSSAHTATHTWKTSHKDTSVRFGYCTKPQVPPHWHVIDRRINK